MKVVKVIHGFPPDYMAGSEVYSFHLVKELTKLVEISVFTTIENDFFSAYETYDEEYEGIKVRRINKSRRDYVYEDKFFDANIDREFKKYLDEKQPDIIHFGHLSHLSTCLLSIVKKEYQLPIVFTVHDFWLFCVKGQLMNEMNTICNGPNTASCHRCSPYSTTPQKVQKMIAYMRNTLSYIDVFLVPSQTLREFFLQQGVPEHKLIDAKYGFDTDKITYRRKTYTSESKINFGFMGRIIPTKGIRVLIGAFKDIDAQLSIYGCIGSQQRFLESDNVIFKGGYENDVVNQVLKSIDVLIVPSTWLENSPLVIQEAFLAGVPVITSNIGGMKELVVDGINGFLFEVGNSQALQNCVLKINNTPTLLNDLSVSKKDVRCIKDDASLTYNLYKRLLTDEK